MGYKTLGVDTEGLPTHIVKAFTDNYPVPVFIETGTAGGESIAVASKLFDRCHTIELFPERVLDRTLPNVTYHTGNSASILPGIIPILDGVYAFFFLDAHFSDSVPNTSGHKECPVLDELKVIASYLNSIVLIDDARLFLGVPPWPCDPREWPKIEEIFAMTKVNFPYHHTTLIDDYILIYPDVLGDLVNTEWSTRRPIRYPSASDRLQTEVKSVYNSFKKYVNNEF